MTKSSHQSGKTPADSRKARLAQALRDNLKRRKAQAKERKGNQPREPDSDGPGGESPAEPGRD